MKKLFIILITLICIGCQDTDEIPFNSADPIVVVEGWLTDQRARHYVKLSSTVAFISPERSLKINDALITLYNNSEPIAQYVNQGNGIYWSEDSIQGIPGKSYHLEVVLSNGDIIRSGRELMPEVAPIDSLGFGSFVRESEDDPQIEETIYFPVAFSDDPAGEENFYRWKLYRNDTLFSDPQHIFLFSDRFVDGNEDIPQEFTAYEYDLDDLARLEILEISRSAYQFLNELKSQKTTLGTNSAVSPAPIRGNLHYVGTDGQVLGYFGVVSITSREKIVQ